jgi:hypothetical protein
MSGIKVGEDAVDKNLRLNFNTNGRTIGGIGVGRLPGIEWEEGRFNEAHFLVIKMPDQLSADPAPFP